MPLSFSGFTIQTNGSAALADTTTLRLTPAVVDQAGSAFITTPFALTPNTNLAASFEFEISGGSTGADGLTAKLRRATASHPEGAGGRHGEIPSRAK
jgi:hypothetical protein